MTGAVYKRCGCVGGAGQRRGSACPLLVRAGHGSWYWTAELGRGVDGRRRRRRRGGYPTRRSAQQALGRLLGAQQPSEVSQLSTGRWPRSWLAQRVDLRPSTRRMYESHLRLYLLPGLARIPLAELSAVQIRVMVAGASAGRRPGRSLSAATLVRVLATLRSALNAAVREGLIESNPVDQVALPPRQVPHPRVWTEARVAAWRAGGARPVVAVWTAAQTARFLDVAGSDPLYPLLHLVAVRGLRRGEAVGLTWEAVDLNLATLTVCRQVLEVGGRLVTGPPKSAASRRSIALDDDTVAMLRGYQAEHGSGPGGYVVSSRCGGPIRPQRLTAAVRRIARENGLPPVRLHDLRHGAASLALAAGADLKAVQDLLGHASIVLTADTYTSVLPEVGRAAAEGVATLIRQAGTQPPGSAR